MTSVRYPVTLEAATDLCEELRLSPWHTFIEPTPYAAFLFDDLATATAFRLRFDAELLPYDDQSQFLMSVRDDAEIEPWLASCGGDSEKVEFVTVGFASEGDRVAFEGMLWPEA